MPVTGTNRTSGQGTSNTSIYIQHYSLLVSLRSIPEYADYSRIHGIAENGPKEHEKFRKPNGLSTSEGKGLATTILLYLWKILGDKSTLAVSTFDQDVIRICTLTDVYILDRLVAGQLIPNLLLTTVRRPKLLSILESVSRDGLAVGEADTAATPYKA